MAFRLRASSLAFTALLATLGGCSSGDGAEDAESDETLARKPVDLSGSRTIFVSATDENGASRDVLLFLTPRAENGSVSRLAAGDVIVARPDSETPTGPVESIVNAINSQGLAPSFFNIGDGHRYTLTAGYNRTGFLRTVTAAPAPLRLPILGLGDVEAQLVVTEHAQLDRAVGAGDKPVSFSNQFDFGSVSLANLSNRQVYSGHGVTLSLETAKLTDHPTVHTTATMRKRRIDQLFFELDGQLDGTILANVSGDAPYTGDLEANLLKTQYTLPPQIVGGVPIVETIHLSVDAQCHVALSGKAALSTGMSLSQAFSLRASYAQGTWKNQSAAPETHLFAEPTHVEASGNATLVCGVTPKFTLLFYDVVGPYLSVTPYAKIDVTGGSDSAWRWTAFGGVSSELGVEPNMQIFGMKKMQSATGLDKAHVSLFEQSRLLSDGTAQ